MRDINIAITAASYSGNKGAAAMLQSSIKQLHDRYGHRLNINLMSVYPGEDREQIPHDFINIVPCTPAKLLFQAFPLAVLHRVFRWLPPVRKLIEKNKVIRAYRETDLVVDEAGISFVDSRGPVMNTYAFVCAAVPMLVGTPVVKYSQALGTFKNPINKFLAKWILPKIKLICARGQGTYDNLKSLGIEKNVKLCADGAFTMEDDAVIADMIEKICAEDAFYQKDVVALSISSVVQKKCTKMGIDYKTAMVDFINGLNERGYNVLIIANAARINSQKPRNNDLMICDVVYDAVADKDKVRWYHKEMDAEEIRSYIGKCRFLVASRFHAMIGALQKKVPVLLVGWSHKYQEVLDMFRLGQYAIDFSKLSAETLLEEFENFVKNEDDIRQKIDENYETVMASSRDNIRYISEVIDGIVEKPSKRLKKLFDYNDPDQYLGEHIACRKGYANDEEIRKNAASGGMITALLCHWLKTGQIDGAWVTKTKIENGELSYDTFIATTEEEIKSCSSSIYMDMPLLKHIDMVKAFPGKVAVVLTPCLTKALTAMTERDAELKAKIAVKLALYCSGNHTDGATMLPLEKSGISLEGAERLYYRRGHWRGRSAVVYADGSEKTLDYKKTICAYKNAYYFEKTSCMTCQDHFGNASDISFGDIWLKEMKKHAVKHTGCVIRSQKGYDMYMDAVKAGVLTESHLSDTKAIKSQKRALVFKFNCAAAKVKKGEETTLNTSSKCKWNHRLAFKLAERNRKYSYEHRDKLKKTPMWMIYYYMCFIRFLLNF